MNEQEIENLFKGESANWEHNFPFQEDDFSGVMRYLTFPGVALDLVRQGRAEELLVVVNKLPALLQEKILAQPYFVAEMIKKMDGSSIDVGAILFIRIMQQSGRSDRSRAHILVAPGAALAFVEGRGHPGTERFRMNQILDLVEHLHEVSSPDQHDRRRHCESAALLSIPGLVERARELGFEERVFRIMGEPLFPNPAGSLQHRPSAPST